MHASTIMLRLYAACLVYAVRCIYAESLRAPASTHPLPATTSLLVSMSKVHRSNTSFVPASVMTSTSCFNRPFPSHSAWVHVCISVCVCVCVYRYVHMHACMHACMLGRSPCLRNDQHQLP